VSAPPSPSPARRVLLSVGAAVTVALGAASVIAGFSDSPPLRLAQGIAVFGAGAVIIGGVVLAATALLGGDRDRWLAPGADRDFEAIVQRAERLATTAGPAAGLDQALDDDEDEAAQARFRGLVRSAIDELPLEFHRALEHVAIVVADGGDDVGGGQRAYGLYQGDTIARDFFSDRIVIFRDTLERDFGDDPRQLKAQVTRTVRHELAHHLGWGERGVRGLGL